MNIEARKYHLIERLMKCDENELRKIEIFLEQESALSASLDRSLNQVQEGKVISHDQVRKKYEKWL
ncbi:hypothetical protein LVD15_13860 [Fulvivirga maritima]|nr:hypothetical protein [Fulvivirga maritima]UII24408.1 hypothetical protein LVD15_13860 [Fulvivirga maritima]